MHKKLYKAKKNWVIGLVAGSILLLGSATGANADDQINNQPNNTQINTNNPLVGSQAEKIANQNDSIAASNQDNGQKVIDYSEINDAEDDNAQWVPITESKNDNKVPSNIPKVSEKDDPNVGYTFNKVSYSIYFKNKLNESSNEINNQDAVENLSTTIARDEKKYLYRSDIDFYENDGYSIQFLFHHYAYDPISSSESSKLAEHRSTRLYFNRIDHGNNIISIGQSNMGNFDPDDPIYSQKSGYYYYTFENGHQLSLIDVLKPEDKDFSWRKDVTGYIESQLKTRKNKYIEGLNIGSRGLPLNTSRYSKGPTSLVFTDKGVVVSVNTVNEGYNPENVLLPMAFLKPEYQLFYYDRPVTFTYCEEGPEGNRYMYQVNPSIDGKYHLANYNTKIEAPFYIPSNGQQLEVRYRIINKLDEVSVIDNKIRNNSYPLFLIKAEPVYDEVQNDINYVSDKVISDIEGKILSPIINTITSPLENMTNSELVNKLVQDYVSRKLKNTNQYKFLEDNLKNAIKNAFNKITDQSNFSITDIASFANQLSNDLDIQNALNAIIDYIKQVRTDGQLTQTVENIANQIISTTQKNKIDIQKLKASIMQGDYVYLDHILFNSAFGENAQAAESVGSEVLKGRDAIGLKAIQISSNYVMENNPRGESFTLASVQDRLSSFENAKKGALDRRDEIIKSAPEFISLAKKAGTIIKKAGMALSVGDNLWQYVTNNKQNKDNDNKERQTIVDNKQDKQTESSSIFKKKDVILGSSVLLCTSSLLAAAWMIFSGKSKAIAMKYGIDYQYNKKLGKYNSRTTVSQTEKGNSINGGHAGGDTKGSK